MNADLIYFLQSKTCLAEETAVWGHLTLRETSYLCPDLPPLPYITSVRGVVLRPDEVLVIQDPESLHILPGGRREAGEPLLQTLQRELLEETGWQVANVKLLGFKHFHHLTPKPPDYPYPYPDFLQVVYVGTAVSYHPRAIDPNGHELGATFYPLAQIHNLPLTVGEMLFLEAAKPLLSPEPQN
jgi:8-oxo-dGTP pyrophosphatase MutT (NUDIX family)